MSSPLIVHRLQVPVSRGDSVITLPAAQGTALAINSTFETEGSMHRALLSYEAAVQHSYRAMGLCSSTWLQSLVLVETWS
jgi:hypothetical protein